MWVVGDVHGYVDKLRAALLQAGLIDDAASWRGGQATLAVLGDLVDRGPDGVGVIELLMRLEAEASTASGKLVAVLGNHDVLLLGACTFGPAALGRPGARTDWRANGGHHTDLERLTPAHVAWLRQLPAMALEQDHLLVHADAGLYLEYGSSVEAVNQTVAQILGGRDRQAWNLLIERFTGHRAFLARDGEALLERYLATYGGRRLVHGHSPLARFTGQAPESVREPYVYREGRCINADPGHYLGGPGFCARLA